MRSETSEGSGRVEVDASEDGMVLISWLGDDGETFRWWKLEAGEADALGDMLKRQAQTPSPTNEDHRG